MTDNGQTDGRRLNGHTISSPCEPKGSGELNMALEPGLYRTEVRFSHEEAHNGLHC